MKINKVIISFVLVGILFTFSNNIIIASNMDNPASYFEEVFKEGALWGMNGSTLTFATSIENFIKNDIGGVLKTIGNVIILIVGVVLGLKFMFANSDTKANVKESLITYAVAVCMWGLASNLMTFIGKDGILGEMLQLLSGDNGVEQIAGTIWKTFSTVANIAMFIALISIGVKYMLAPSVDKAQLKQQLGRVVIGLILALSTVNVISFIGGIGYELMNSAKYGGVGNETEHLN